MQNEVCQAKAADLAREAKVFAARAKEIDDAVYDVKAVNPHKRSVIDKRTPDELLDIIEAKGQEIAEALTSLRATANPRIPANASL